MPLPDSGGAGRGGGLSVRLRRHPLVRTLDQRSSSAVQKWTARSRSLTNSAAWLRREIVICPPGLAPTSVAVFGPSDIPYDPIVRQRTALLISLGLVLAACGGGSNVADFTEIAASEPMFEFDPSGTVVRLHVDTTVDAVCAVAYGETEALGALATDQDMDAAGHQDHGPILAGLEPETTYFYRLQGVGPDGTLYQSELLTFTTPAAAEAGAGTNLALAATVTEVSSEFSDAFAAANAIDGNPATEWSSRGDGDDAFITLDLGTKTTVAGLRFVTREMSDGSSVTTTYTVTVDGGETLGPFDAGLTARLVEVSFTGRVLRFDVATSTGGNTGAVEIEIYGD